MNRKSESSVAARRARATAKLLLAVGALGTLGSLGACGQKGPLTLPAAAQPASAPASGATR